MLYTRLPFQFPQFLTKKFIRLPNDLCLWLLEGKVNEFNFINSDSLINYIYANYEPVLTKLFVIWKEAEIKNNAILRKTIEIFKKLETLQPTEISWSVTKNRLICARIPTGKHLHLSLNTSHTLPSELSYSFTHYTCNVWGENISGCELKWSPLHFIFITVDCKGHVGL